MRNSPGARQHKPKHLTNMLQSLRAKTGLLEIEFDEDGFLRIGDPTRISGGSQLARDLLASAMEGPLAFDLESHDRSAIVAFARLGSPISYQSRMTGAQIEVLPLEIDFTDFERLQGDRQVLAAFDLGFVLLHELTHGVLRLPDAESEKTASPGPCEEHVNLIRRQLGLPERQHYYARLSERNRMIGGTIKQAELLFRRDTPRDGKVKREHFIISWEAAQVGPIQSYAEREKMRARTIAMK
jgi:hypothetical protein